MKKYLLILTLLIISTRCFAQDGSGKHFVAGVGIAWATSEIEMYRTKNVTLSIGAGLLTSTGAGVAKEASDKYFHTGTATALDAFRTTSGGMLGVMIFGCRIDFKLP